MIYLCTIVLIVVTNTLLSVSGECAGVLDLVFVVDSSALIKETDPYGWIKLKWFIIDITREFTISQMDVRVGLTTFSDYASERPNSPGDSTSDVEFFYLNTYNDSSSLENAIHRLHYFGSSTNMGDGVRVAYHTLLKQSNGDRPDVQNIVIVISGGAPSVPILPTETDALKMKAFVVVISVSSSVNRVHLGQIASRLDYVLDIREYTEIDEILKIIINAVC